MKSQLMTALSIVGVLGTATTAMAVNTDALATLDPGAIGTATDTLLPGTAVPVDPAAPVATPAPADPSATATPVDPTTPQTGGTAGGTAGIPSTVQNPQTAPVNGTSGGSGSRVNPATGAVVNYQDDEDDDHDEDGEHEDEHEEEDDD
jgi:hypothetical protein